MIVCNPNNPTGTCLPPQRIAEFMERVPGHVTVILDEAYVEMQTLDDPDATLDLLPRFPNLVLLRTFSKVYGLAGLRCGYALGSARFRAAVDAVRQPFSVNLLSQAAGAEAILHGDDVARPGRARPWPSGSRSRRSCASMGLTTADTQTNFSWIDLGPDRDEAEIVEGLGRAGVIVRPGTPLGGPGHIRVSYGTAAENQKFLEALRGPALTWYNPRDERPADLTSTRPPGRPSACLALVSAIYLGVRPGLACPKRTSKKLPPDAHVGTPDRGPRARS